MYSITLSSNHKEHSTVLIGITNTPKEFINKWIESRTQFTVVEDKGLTVEVVRDRNVEEEKYIKYKHNSLKPLYTHWLKAKELTHEIKCYVPIKGDAEYAL